MTKPAKSVLSSGAVLSLYLALLLFVAVFIGYFGIISNLRTYSELAEKHKQYKELSADLATKKETLQQNLKVLKDLNVNENLLDKSLPDEFNYEGFVEDLINTSSGYDFAIEKIEFLDNENDTANAVVTFENLADNSNTINLINSFNRLPRLSFLERLDFEGKYSKKTIKAEFRIFKLPR